MTAIQKQMIRQKCPSCHTGKLHAMYAYDIEETLLYCYVHKITLTQTDEENLQKARAMGYSIPQIIRTGAKTLIKQAEFRANK